MCVVFILCVYALCKVCGCVGIEVEGNSNLTLSLTVPQKIKHYLGLSVTIMSIALNKLRMSTFLCLLLLDLVIIHYYIIIIGISIIMLF